MPALAIAASPRSFELGVAGCRRLVDELTLESVEPGGTRVRRVEWAHPWISWA